MAQNYYLPSDYVFKAIGLLENIAMNKILLNHGYPIPTINVKPIDFESPNDHLFEVLSIVFGEECSFQSTDYETIILTVPKTFFIDNGDELIAIKIFNSYSMWEYMDIEITENGDFLSFKIEGEHLGLSTFNQIMEILKEYKKEKGE